MDQKLQLPQVDKCMAHPPHKTRVQPAERAHPDPWRSHLTDGGHTIHPDLGAVRFVHGARPGAVRHGGC